MVCSVTHANGFFIYKIDRAASLDFLKGLIRLDDLAGIRAKYTFSEAVFKLLHGNRYFARKIGKVLW